MPTHEETEALWEAIVGAAPLRERYGYWPSLHDAVVRGMNFKFADRELSIVLDYSNSELDINGEEVNKDEEVKTRLTLRWHGITESKLRLYANDLYGMKFAQKNGLIETRFDDYVWGLDGFILSAGVEVTNIAPAPDMSELLESDPAHHTIEMAIG